MHVDFHKRGDGGGGVFDIIFASVYLTFNKGIYFGKQCLWERHQT